jgi:hypothetical protein
MPGDRGRIFDLQSLAKPSSIGVGHHSIHFGLHHAPLTHFPRPVQPLQLANGMTELYQGLSK